MASMKEILESDNNNVIQDESFLRVPCDTVSIEDGEEIASKLFRVMTARNDGFGLSANQIGIQKRVCVMNVKSPIYLINPKIVEASGKLVYYESCLSFPGKTIRTERFSCITVECDNYDEQLYWDVDGTDLSLDNLDVIELVTLQHEIAHLNGKTMFDFENKQVPIKKLDEYGRNDKINITNGTETKVIKYKQFSEYETKGYHIVK